MPVVLGLFFFKGPEREGGLGFRVNSIKSLDQDCHDGNRDYQGDQVQGSLGA